MDSEEFSEYFTDPAAVEDCHDGYRAIRRHGHSIVGQLVRHGQVWFVKSYDSGSDITECELRLQKEFGILLRLNHPSIVRAGWLESIPEVGPSLVLEYVDGESLDEFLTHASKLQRRIVSDSLLHALAYMHARGVVHLDLKPQNIMVTGKGRMVDIKIVDFGMSQCASNVMFRHSGGTRSFSDPQQFKAGYEANPNSDVYAAGRLLEQINGGRIFRQMAKRAVRENPDERPADGNALLDLQRKIRRKRLLSYCIATVASIALAAAILLPHFSHEAHPATGRIVPDGPDTASIALSSNPAIASPQDSLVTSSSAMAAASVPTATEIASVRAASSEDIAEHAPAEDEYNRLIIQWQKELHRRATKMETVARDESIPKSQRRLILEEMNEKIITDTQDFFRPFIEKQDKATVMAHPLSWCSIYESAFKPARMRMKIAYETLND